jgi:biopolymer transport protein ExbD
MKFPRNARILRGQLDAVPFVALFFLLVMFLMLASLVYTPGVQIDLPVADGLPGTDKPSVAVAIDANGRFYFENQAMEELQLSNKLNQAVREAGEPLTLVVQADKKVSNEMLIHVALLAKEAGISQAWLATLPRPSAKLP